MFRDTSSMIRKLRKRNSYAQFYEHRITIVSLEETV